MAEILRVRVKRFRFAKPGFIVAEVEHDQVTADGHHHVRDVVAVGALEQVREGDEAELSGSWMLHPQHGEQFKVTSALPTIPAGQRGVEGFLERLPQIGPKRARDIVTHFGVDQVFDVIEKTPHRLEEVPGLTVDRAHAIIAAYQDQRTRRDTLVALKKCGLTDWQVAKVLEWGRVEAQTRRREGLTTDPEEKVQGDVIREALALNPYVWTEIRGFGFLTVDKIALAAGVPHHSPQRCAAAIEFVLEEAQNAGHCYLPGQEISGMLRELTGISGEVVAKTAAALLERGRIVRRPLPGTKDVAVYQARLDELEDRVATFFRARTVGQLVDPKPQRCAPELDPEQVEAVEAALDPDVRMVVVTGGPGTGKSRMVREICRLAGTQRLNVALCSPTGKAAKRLAEQAEHPASTIHRLLAWSPIDHDFIYNELNPLPHDLLVVDETSMIDLELCDALTRACAAPTKLVFVGDVDQLPSIGPGQILRDLIASTRIHCIRLTKLHRQAEHSYIATNAHRLNRGEDPIVDPHATDYFWLPTDDPELAFEMARRLVVETIPKRHQVDRIADIQVLCPQRKGVIGIHRFNAELQALLNPPKGPKPVEVTNPRGQSFRVGDKVRHTRNNYQLVVMNGEVGIVKAIRPKKVGHAMDAETDVDYGDRVVTYPKTSTLAEITLNYASTVHASQGSEYPVVVLLVHGYNFYMLSRNLVYTGLTRAKQAVYLVGDERGLKRARTNIAVAQRYTGLEARIREPQA